MTMWRWLTFPSRCMSKNISRLRPDILHRILTNIRVNKHHLQPLKNNILVNLDRKSRSRVKTLTVWRHNREQSRKIWITSNYLTKKDNLESTVNKYHRPFHLQETSMKSFVKNQRNSKKLNIRRISLYWGSSISNLRAFKLRSRLHNSSLDLPDKNLKIKNCLPWVIHNQTKNKQLAAWLAACHRLTKRLQPLPLNNRTLK